MNDYIETGKVYNVGGGFKIPMTVSLKKCDDWNNSGQCMDEFLSIGDAVDDDFTEYMVCCLPPKTWTSSIIQMGEPYSTDRSGHFTYLTFKKIGNIWYYIGAVSTEKAKTCDQWGK